MKRLIEKVSDLKIVKLNSEVKSKPKKFVFPRLLFV